MTKSREQLGLVNNKKKKRKKKKQNSGATEPECFTTHFNMIFHSRISVSWVWAVLGRGCLMRSRHCRMSIMITPIRITQTTRPPMIRISCKSTGINAKRHGRLKSRLFGSSGETTIFLLLFLSFSLSSSSSPLSFFSLSSPSRKTRDDRPARRNKNSTASARDCLTTPPLKFRETRARVN